MSSTYSEGTLIENVHAHPSLYDIFLVKDKDHNVRREAWQEIGDALNTPGKYYIIILIGPIRGGLCVLITPHFELSTPKFVHVNLHFQLVSISIK